MRLISLETACGAAAPSSSTPSGMSLSVSVPVQVRPSAMSADGTSPWFSPAGAESAVGVGVAVGSASGVPGPPLK